MLELPGGNTFGVQLSLSHDAGIASAVVVAEEELASPSTPPAPPAPPAGGKAKASKGKGRTPAVKGQPKPFKKRQGR